MPKPGAERTHAPQEALSEGEQYVDATFIRDSEEYRSLLTAFHRIESGKKSSISLEQFDEMLDGDIALADGSESIPEAIQQRTDAARQFDKDMKAGIVEPEIYAAKRNPPEAKAMVEMDLSDEEGGGEREEVELEAVDAADVQKAREHMVYRDLFERLEKAAQGNGSAETIMEAVAYEKDRVLTLPKGFQEKTLAAIEQFEADLSTDLAELWRRVLGEDVKRAATEADDQKTEAGRRPTKNRPRKKRRKEPTAEQYRWFTGINVNAQRLYRELLEEYREQVEGSGTPDPEKLQEYQAILIDKAKNANSVEEQSAYETFANDLERGVVQNIIETFDSEDALVEGQMEAAIGAARERVQRGDTSDAVRRVAELNTDQMMQLYAAQKQLDEMGFFGKTFSKAGREAKKARKEFESLNALIHKVERLEESDRGLVMKEVEEPPQELTFESLQSEWPQEVNSIMGALKAGNISPIEAVRTLDELERDVVKKWTATLVGKKLGGIRNGSGRPIIGNVEIGQIKKDTGGTLRIHLRDDAGKRYNLSLATFLKQNMPVAERDVSAAA